MKPFKFETGGMPGGFPGAGAQQPSGAGDTSGPTIEEVD